MFHKISKRVVNNIYLGLCFVVLFSAFSGLSSVQKTITVSIRRENPSYHADGFISMGIIYTMLSIGMWLSPGIIAKTGSKYAMILGTISNGVYMAAFYTENSLCVYLGAAICGFGGSLLWTGQANYIVLNSEIGKVHSGIGVFWILYQSSHFVVNIIIYFLISDVSGSINKAMRTKIISIFVGFATFATIMMFGIRPPLRQKEQNKVVRNPCTEISKSGKILITSRMLLLLMTMISVGLHLSFLGVLRASMGFSGYLSNNSKQLAPLCGILEGCGEITGGILSIVLGSKKMLNMKSVITFGCISNLLCYIVMFLALPNDSPHFHTNDLPILPLPTVIVLSSAILAGIGDASYHTEMYDVIGTMYPNDSASAFAVFKFIRSLATAGNFYYGKTFGLHTQLTVLITLTILSWISYHCLQWFLIKPQPVDNEKREKEVSDLA